MTNSGHTIAALNQRKIGFIGVGNMGEAVVLGLTRHAQVPNSQIIATTLRDETAQRAKAKLGIEVSTDNRWLARESDVIILAVKWDAVDSVLREIASEVTANKLIISLAGATTTNFIEQRLNCPIPVVLAIPNTPCAISYGATLICPGKHAEDEDISVVESIFGQLGLTFKADRNTIDTLIALTSCGPALYYLFIESFMDAAVKRGLSRADARKAAVQCMLGAAQMLLQTDAEPAILRAKITTKGGSTLAGLNALEERDIRGTIETCVDAIVNRLSELRDSMGTK